MVDVPRSLLFEVSRAAITAEGRQALLEQTVDGVCKVTGWPVGHVLAWDGEGSLHSTGIWSSAVRNGAYPRFREQSEERLFAVAEDLPGAVAASGGPVWIPNLQETGTVARSDRNGLLRTAVGVPARTEGALRYVLEFFSPAVTVEDPDLLGALEQAATLLAAAAARAESTAAERLAVQTESQFLAMLSHELRGPVTAVKGLVHTVLTRWADLTDADRLRLLDRAGAATGRLHALVADILELMRAGEEGEPPARSVLSVTALVEEVADDFRIRDAAPRVDLADGDLYVLAERRHVRVALSNLIANAQYHGRPPVVVSAERVDGMVDIRVRDHGDGVPEHLVERLFHRFVAGEGSSGTGLGLDIAARLANQIGGEVRYAPAQPGSEFSLCLEAAAESADVGGAMPAPRLGRR